MRRVTFVMFLVLGLTALACSSDDGKSADDDGEMGGRRPDGGTQRDGGGDAGVSVAACMSAGPLPGCSKAQVDEIVGCFENACKSELEVCYGENYASNQFSGPCASEAMCASKCACGDDACTASCPVSEGCSTCARSFVACGSRCIDKLGCALGAPDAGPDNQLDLACEALSDCCDSLSEPAKTECKQAHAQVVGAGSFLCLLVIPLYCP